MACKYDENLEFLTKVNSQDLDDLVFILNVNSSENEEYTKEVIGKIKLFGFGSFVCLFDEKCRLYREILVDVCEYLEVNFDKNLSTKKIENSLFLKILEEAIDKMPKDDFQKMIYEVKKENKEIFYCSKVVSKQALLVRFQLLFENEDLKSHILTTMIVNAIIKALLGKGLSNKYNILNNHLFMKFLTGPIGWVITTSWATIDVVSSYRVTILTVIYVAYLRQKCLYE